MDKLLSSNAEEILALKTTMDLLKKDISSIKKDIAKLKIDSENSVRSSQIKSGTGTKISYNKFGLVESSSSLEAKDIPEIPISKVMNLEEIIENLNDSIKKTEKAIAVIDAKKAVAPKSSKKSPITIQEIPDLPISKIKKLSEKLELLEKPKPEPKKEKIKILEEDIPQIIKNRIQNLEETVHTKADKDSVSKVKSSIETIKISTDEISNEISKLKSIKPETKISSEAMPSITVEKVNGLDKILNRKADSADIISIHQLLDLTNKNTSSAVKMIQAQMENKVSQEQFSYLKNTMDRIEILLAKVLEQYPVL